jgi:hypothetical protein
MKKLIVVLLLFSFSSCDLFRNEQAAIELSSFYFSRGSLFYEPYEAYKSDEPIILISAALENDYKNALVNATLSNVRGDEVMVRLYSFYDIPNKEFASVLNDYNGQAFVIIKEANKQRAFDRESKVYTTTEETVSKTIDWIVSFDGVEILTRFSPSPTFLLRIESKPELLSTLRSSKNIDIIEPNFRAIPFNNPGSNRFNEYFQFQRKSNQREITIVGVVNNLTDKKNELQLVEGDTVWATYDQPDGSVLKSYTTIKGE